MKQFFFYTALCNRNLPQRYNRDVFKYTLFTLLYRSFKQLLFTKILLFCTRNIELIYSQYNVHWVFLLFLLQSLVYSILISLFLIHLRINKSGVIHLFPRVSIILTVVWQHHCDMWLHYQPNILVKLSCKCSL